MVRMTWILPRLYDVIHKSSSDDDMLFFLHRQPVRLFLLYACISSCCFRPLLRWYWCVLICNTSFFDVVWNHKCLCSLASTFVNLATYSLYISLQDRPWVSSKIKPILSIESIPNDFDITLLSLVSQLCDTNMHLQSTVTRRLVLTIRSK